MANPSHINTIITWIRELSEDPERYYKLVKEEIEKGYDVKAINEYGYTAFRYLCRDGFGFTNGQAAKFSLQLGLAILEKHYDVHAKDEFKRTALHLLCKNGFKNGETAKFSLQLALAILERHYDVNAKDDFRSTASHYLCEYGFKDGQAAQYSLRLGLAILEKNCEVNAKDKYGRTALHWLCIFGFENVQAAKFSLRLGRAILERHYRVIERHYKVNAKDTDGRTAFYFLFDSYHPDAEEKAIKLAVVMVEKDENLLREKGLKKERLNKVITGSTIHITDATMEDILPESYVLSEPYVFSESSSRAVRSHNADFGGGRDNVLSIPHSIPSTSTPSDSSNRPISKITSTVQKDVIVPTIDEIKNDYRAGDGEKECVICMDNKPLVIANPCGHLCICIACSRSLALFNGKPRKYGDVLCPICRANVNEFKRVYF